MLAIDSTGKRNKNPWQPIRTHLQTSNGSQGPLDCTPWWRHKPPGLKLSWAVHTMCGWPISFSGLSFLLVGQLISVASSNSYPWAAQAPNEHSPCTPGSPTLCPASLASTTRRQCREQGLGAAGLVRGDLPGGISEPHKLRGGDCSCLLSGPLPQGQWALGFSCIPSTPLLSRGPFQPGQLRWPPRVSHHGHLQLLSSAWGRQQRPGEDASDLGGTGEAAAGARGCKSAHRRSEPSRSSGNPVLTELWGAGGCVGWVQFDFSAWIPNVPTTMRLPPPTSKGRTSLLASLPEVSATCRTLVLFQGYQR